MNNYVSLQVNDGSTMNAYTAFPDTSGTYPGIILLQEAFGVNSHIRDVAGRLAREGYAVIAPELYHRTAPGIEISYDDFPSARPHIEALTPQGLEADLKASFNWLSAQQHVSGKIGTIGFCLGGMVSLLANAVLGVSAAVGFYGGRSHQFTHLIPQLHAPQLFFWGGLDKHINKENINTVTQAMEAAQKPFTNVVISYADHGFFCDERGSYHPKAAQEAWAMTLAFFKSNLQ